MTVGLPEASVFIGLIGCEEGAGDFGMPAEALDFVGTRLLGDGRIDRGLIQRLAVEARHTANGHGGFTRVLIGFGGFHASVSPVRRVEKSRC